MTRDLLVGSIENHGVWNVCFLLGPTGLWETLIKIIILRRG